MVTEEVTLRREVPGNDHKQREINIDSYPAHPSRLSSSQSMAQGCLRLRDEYGELTRIQGSSKDILNRRVAKGTQAGS